MPLFKMRRFYYKIRRMAEGVLMWWTMMNVLTGGAKGEYDVCYDDANKEYLACNPSMYDVMWDAIADIRVDPATATCGTPPSLFRRLAPRNTVNETCSAASTTLRHPPNYMIDDNATSWWQSVNMLPGTQELNINITVSFNKTFRMNSDVIITFNSGRPNKMILEKSSDFGATWQPLQYYAKNCDDFQAQLVPGAEITADNPTAVICTNMYTETTPRAVVGRTVKLVNEDRFDLFLGPLKIEFAKFYEALELKLLDFLLFTDMRIRLIQPLTDGKTTYDMYYYAISDIQAVARCFCNLHAAVCNYTDTDIICDCDHNTMGKNCETCKPLYNERLWQKGSYLPYPKGQANPCIRPGSQCMIGLANNVNQDLTADILSKLNHFNGLGNNLVRECECNDHAESCTYNETYGRGICDVCLHNTRGYHCELCVLKYYPNVSLPLNDKDRCIACNCELLGVLDQNLVCSQTESESTKIGQCICKALTTGRMCDQCIPGYYGLLTGPVPGNCTECNCNLAGTVGESNTCAQDTGQCPCKQTTEHRMCDACKDGYFSFPTGNPLRECYSCNCDKGGSLSAVCDKVNGSCPCRTNITSSKCDQTIAGTFIPAVDVLTYQPLPGICNVTSDLYTDQQPFDGTNFAVCDIGAGSATLQFENVLGGMVQRALQWPYLVAVRYSTNVSYVTGTVTVNATGNTTQALSALSIRLGQMVTVGCTVIGQSIQTEIQFVPGTSTAAISLLQNFTIDARCDYKLILQLHMNISSLSTRDTNPAGSVVTIDSVALLPTLSSSDGSLSFEVYAKSDNQTKTQETYLSCLQQLSSLLTRKEALAQSPCKELLYSVGTELSDGAKACSCNEISTVSGSFCKALGGQCQCKPGVSGRDCGICTPGYFNFTDSGCVRCLALPCETEFIVATTTTSTSTTSTTTPTTSTASNTSAPSTLPTTEASNTTSSNTTIIETHDGGLSGGFIALIVICIIIAIGIIILIIWCKCLRKRSKENKSVADGLYTITRLGLGNPNSPVYSNSLYDQHSRWLGAGGRSNPPEQMTTFTISDVEAGSDSVFESPEDQSSTLNVRPKFFIASDDNSRSLDRKRTPQLNLKQPSPEALKSSPKNEHTYLGLKDLNSPPEHTVSDISFDAKFNRDIYPHKPRARSVEVEANNFKNLKSPDPYDGSRLHQWRPISDLRMSAVTPDNENSDDNLSASDLFSTFKPLLANEKSKPKPKSFRHSSNKPRKKSPKKPARQKRPNRKSSFADRIIPPPPMYGGDNAGFVPDPDYDSYSDSRPFIPRPDYSVFGSYENPVFIPEPDYPTFAGYDSFDEINGSLV